MAIAVSPCKLTDMRVWWMAVTLAACQSPDAAPPAADDVEAERARLIQCCQGLIHEAWNSDPPNAQVLHAARDCEALAREGKLRQARSRLAASGRQHACDNCPVNGCRPTNR